MKKITTLLSALALTTAMAASAFAAPVPVTNTTKAPYKAAKVYCNDSILKPSKGENIACYNHDACYSDPRGRSRADCDNGYLRDMREAGLATLGMVKYRALRMMGEAYWKRCRENDRRQAQQ